MAGGELRRYKWSEGAQAKARLPVLQVEVEPGELAEVEGVERELGRLEAEIEVTGPEAADDAMFKFVVHGRTVVEGSVLNIEIIPLLRGSPHALVYLETDGSIFDAPPGALLGLSPGGREVPINTK